MERFYFCITLIIIEYNKYGVASVGLIMLLVPLRWRLNINTHYFLSFIFYGVYVPGTASAPLITDKKHFLAVWGSVLSYQHCFKHE